MMYTGSLTKDVSFHIGFVTKKEDDPRRHKSRCIHIMDGTCMCGALRCYNHKCPGSAHCSHYSETDLNDGIDAEEEKERMEQEERSKQLQLAAIKRMQATPKRRFINRSFEDMFTCQLCSTRLMVRKGQEGVKTCPYCMAKYSKVNSEYEVGPADSFLVMHKPSCSKKIKRPQTRNLSCK